MPCERDDPGYQIGSARIDLVDELPVNLDVVERKTPEQIKIAVLSPEIVNGELHAFGLQCGESGRCSRAVGKKKPLGKFEDEARIGRQAPDYGHDLVNETRAFQIMRSDVDSDSQGRRGRPGFHFCKCSLKYEAGHLRQQVARLDF